MSRWSPYPHHALTTIPIFSTRDPCVLGFGCTGIVIRTPANEALKLPFRTKDTTDEDLHKHIKAIRYEMDVYERLEDGPGPDIGPNGSGSANGTGTGSGPCNGVVKVLEKSDCTLTLELMAKSDLHTYLNRCESKEEPAIPRARQVAWFVSMARALGDIHDRKVLVQDIASRNLLLDENLNIKFADFSHSKMFGLNENLPREETSGFYQGVGSVKNDILELGTVMAEVLLTFPGGHREPDILQMEMVLNDGNIPSTEGLWLGWVVTKCWMKRYESAKELLEELLLLRPGLFDGDVADTTRAGENGVFDDLIPRPGGPRYI